MQSAARISSRHRTSLSTIVSLSRQGLRSSGDDSCRHTVLRFNATTIKPSRFHSIRVIASQNALSTISPSSRAFSSAESQKKDNDNSNDNDNKNNDNNKNIPRKNNNVADEKNEAQPTLEDTIHRMKQQGQEDEATERANSSSSSSGSVQSSSNDVLRKAVVYWDRFLAEVREAWDDLVRSGQRKSINKKIHPVETKEGDAPYTGKLDLMIIPESEHLTAWERMQKRLTDAPIIQDILSRSEKIYHESGAAKIKEKVDVVKEDAKEAWETSQNPWVYRVSSVYDTLTAETSESIAVKELRKLDPEFTLDGWRQDVVEHTLPSIMQWFLEGRINQLKPWLGEGVFKRLAAEMTAREKEGVKVDTHVLGIMNSEILAVEPDEVNKGSPIIVLHFMCQQINCVRKKEDGSVVEGSEDDIRANSYVAAFQREYDEAKGELNWKIVDFRFNGAIAYL